MKQETANEFFKANRTPPTCQPVPTIRNGVFQPKRRLCFRPPMMWHFDELRSICRMFMHRMRLPEIQSTELFMWTVASQSDNTRLDGGLE